MNSLRDLYPCGKIARRRFLFQTAAGFMGSALSSLWAEDGQLMQDARTSDLIFDVPRLVAELSAVLPLLPGDVIFTGTPAGVGIGSKPPRFLQPGETVESWIEGIGTIRNRFIAH